MKIQYKDFILKVDLAKGAIDKIHVKQNETGARLCIRLTHNGEEYTVGQTEDISVVFKRPDGAVFYIPCGVEGNEHGFLSVVLTEQVLALHGQLKCEVQIVGSIGLVKSSTFLIVVQPSLTEDEG